MTIPSELTDQKDRRVSVLRAWPRSDGSLVVEGREEGSGRVRAGRIDPRGRASLVPFRTDAALPGLSPETPVGELLVHRLKRRAVVHTDGRYRKFVAGGKARSVAGSHQAAAGVLAGSGLAVPDVVASDEYSLTLTTVPGVGLHELGRALVPAQGGPGKHPEPAGGSQSPDAWELAWNLWAERWPGFVQAPASAPVAVTRTHSSADEVGTIERWASLAISSGALGVSEERIEETLTRVRRSLLAGASPAGLSHRDLHDKQILVDSGAGSLGIIDCDTLALAEPALDLANLSVHLDFRVAQGLLPSSAAAVGKNHIQQVAEALQVPATRFAAYASATALRLACIYAFRPPYNPVASAWFAEVEADLLCVANRRRRVS